MGHGSNDKLYITHGEHSGIFGQHAASTGARLRPSEAGYQPLPYDCCALSLQPWTNPVCSKEDGTIFELTNVIPFIKKYGVNPATGKKLELKELVRLNFAKNADGKYHDPVSFKDFNEHTHIVAIATSGNVFSYETVQQLNIKAKFLRDLVSDQAFTKTDLITLQDPHNVEQRDFSKLHHVKQNLIVTDADKGVNDTEEVNVAATGSAGTLLKSMRSAKEAKEGARTNSDASCSAVASTSREPLPPPKPAQSKVPYNASVGSTGMAAASLTSTALTPQTRSERALINEEEFMFEQVSSVKGKEKGYVRLTTNFGNINLELHADRAPKTCYNFLSLAREGKYTDTVFHRNIPGFMLQGGDPDGTGRGGKSIWGQPFRDEYDVKGAFKHTARGTLSMANSGPDTNGSQFFITYRSTPHLDGKHTVFGRVVNDDGDKVLQALENVPTEPGTDRPLRTIRILDVQVFDDPFERYKDKLRKKLEREGMGEAEMRKREEKRKRREDDRTTWLGTHLPARGTPGAEAAASKTASSDEPALGMLGSATGVGKYLAGSSKGRSAPTKQVAAAAAARSNGEEEVGAAYAKKRKTGGSGFGDFSGW